MSYLPTSSTYKPSHTPLPHSQPIWIALLSTSRVYALYTLVIATPAILITVEGLSSYQTDVTCQLLVQLLHHIVLQNSCLYMIYPTFSSPPTEHPISPSTNSSLHWTNTKICPHSFPTPHSSKRNPVPILDASSCFTFLILIRFALPPALRSTGLHLVLHMFSSLGSAAAPHSLRSTGPPLHFPFLHRTILHLSLLLVQQCGSLP